MDCYNDTSHTKSFVRTAVGQLEAYFQRVHIEITSKRSSSPFALPLKNFDSEILFEAFKVLAILTTYDTLDDWLKKKRVEFRNRHSWRRTARTNRPCFHDKRQFAFQPTDASASHGESSSEHTISCYLNGCLRFGSNLLQGFHFDVQPRGNTVEGTFYRCDGTIVRILKGRYEYINI